MQVMLPPGVTLHATRLHFAAMRPGGEMDPKIPHTPVRSFVEPPHVDDAVELLAASPLDVIATGFTSSAYKHGPEGEHALLERLAKRSRGIPLVSTCLAATRGLRALGVNRLALVNPPWFDDKLDAQGAEFFTAQGFEVVHHSPCGLPSSQTAITPEGLYDWVRSVAGDAEGVFIGGNGLRAVGVIEVLEEDLGIPVLTANQVLVWESLWLAGCDAPVTGYGKLFQVTPAVEVSCSVDGCSIGRSFWSKGALARRRSPLAHPGGPAMVEALPNVWTFRVTSN